MICTFWAVENVKCYFRVPCSVLQNCRSEQPAVFRNQIRGIRNILGLTGSGSVKDDLDVALLWIWMPDPHPDCVNLMRDTNYLLDMKKIAQFFCIVKLSSSL